MPDNHSIEFLQDALLPLGINKARRKCLAAALLALLTTRSVNLKRLAALFPTDAKTDSAYKRLQRFFRFLEIDRPSLAMLLVRWCRIPAPWHLAMDRTNWKLGALHLNLLLLCIVAGPISFPLLWIGLSKESEEMDMGTRRVGKAGNTNTAERIALIRQFVALFGAKSCACLRADREFASGEFLRYLEEAKLPYQLRLKGDTLLTDRRGELCCADYLFRDCPVQQERRLGLRRVLGKLRFVTGTRLASGDFLILVSNEERPLLEYALRWGIEPMFGALKSRGFDLEATHITDPTRLSRLLCLLALAYTWAGACGLWEFHQRLLKVKKHGRMPISVFRLGLDFLQPIAAKLCRSVSKRQQEIALQILSCT
jgi:hypothetical protein